MYSRLCMGFVSSTSLGLGVIIGSLFEKDTRTIYVGDITGHYSSDLHKYIPVPSIHAKSLVHQQDKSTTVGDITPKQSSVALTKHGYPSYENLRVFDDYILSYDKKNRGPHWVLEHLTKDKLVYSENTKRQEVFQEDSQIHHYFRSKNDDYKKSGYDRGHMAAAGNHHWSQSAMDQTFYLSNISPQVGKGFNRDSWNTLEKQVRHLNKEHKNVYVCTGPLYLPRREEDGKMYVKYEVIGINHVSVPTHFFKVVLCEKDNGEFHLLSFVMPNKALPEKVDLKNYLVPLESIERAAGFLIFNSIPKNKLRAINGNKT